MPETQTETAPEPEIAETHTPAPPLRVLVTGGCGFIGSHLVDLLADGGYQVMILDNLDQQVHPGGKLPAWTEEQLHKGVQFQLCDICDKRGVYELLRAVRPQVIVHLAARVGVGQAEEKISSYVETNVLGTAILLEMILRANEEITDPDDGVRRLITAGSMSSYGEGMWICPAHGPHRPERSAADLAEGIWAPVCAENGCELQLYPTAIPEWSSLRPRGVYAATKRDQEDLSLLVSAAYGLSVAVTRFFNVIGERQSISNPYTGVAAIFAGRVLAGMPPRVYEDGEQLRDLIHVSDVASAILSLLGPNDLRLAERTWANAECQGVFNVSTGRGSTIADIARVAHRELSPDGQAPEITGQYRTADIRACIGDSSKLQSATGWRPTISAPHALRALYESLSEQEGPSLTEERLEAAHRALLSAGLIHTPIPLSTLPAAPEQGARPEGDGAVTEWVR